jgi:hypothetical protein
VARSDHPNTAGILNTLATLHFARQGKGLFPAARDQHCRRTPAARG